MRNTLHLKFFLLLFAVALVALSGTVVLRQLMLQDFADYLDGQAEDKVYAMLAGFEGLYERDSGWNQDNQGQLALWSLTLGFEVRILDKDGRIVASASDAVRQASPALKRRLSALFPPIQAQDRGAFTPYPLFLEGRQIGTLELRALKEAKESLFVGRADRFLLLSILIVGGLAILLSILFSSRLTRPIKELAHAASAISRGDLRRRVGVSRGDEVGELGRTFNRMADGLERQETLRRKLIADVAHELRTPLGVMRGEIEGMMDGLIPNDEKRLESLYEETGRLKGLVEGIEELNQAEAGALALRIQPVPLKPFLDGIVNRFRLTYEEKGIILRLQCEDGAELQADPERLSQIIVNLLSNAQRATERGGTVMVSATGDDKSRSIIVEDNGKGIGDEDLPFIFERFYKGRGGGLGIGLTIVKELVEAHGGRIEVRSTPGEGSSFILFFPSDGLHNSS
jgi:two-component system, OmpR family, sensor histidine kinase BaeS